jgi:hypothetical protein
MRVLQEPITKAVNNGHQRGLIQVTAYARSRPWLLAIGMEADCHTHVRGSIVC